MFQEPDVIATFDRSYGDKKEELRLEKGEFNGNPTFTLRLHWQAGDGTWRWAAQKPTQSGKCWERLNLKAKELKALGEALIAASKQSGGINPKPAARKEPQHAVIEEDDIPF
jgi:hypothetical protein